MTLTREQRRHALAPVREQWDGDAWGSTLNPFFDLAHFMDAAGIDIPSEWEFRMGAGYDLGDIVHAFQCDDVDGTCPVHACASGELDRMRDWLPFLDAGELGIEMLTYAGNVLSRMAALVKRAGKDY